MNHHSNRMNYYQNSLTRFIKSDRPLMLIIGQYGSGKTQLITQFCNNIDITTRTLKLTGHESTTPNDIVTLLCSKCGLTMPANLLSHRSQLDNILQQLRQNHLATLLIVTNAEHLSIGSLAALSHLASSQEEPPVPLHLILSGQITLEKKIASLMAFQPPHLMLKPLNRKETFAYIKSRLHSMHDTDIVTPKEIMEKIYEHSGGFLNLINYLLQHWQESIKRDQPNDSHSTPSLQKIYTNTGQPKSPGKKKYNKKAALCSAIILVGVAYFSYHNHSKNFAIQRSPKLVQIVKSAPLG